MTQHNSLLIKSTQHNSLYLVCRALYMKDAVSTRNKYYREAKMLIKEMPDNINMGDKSSAFMRAFNDCSGGSCAMDYTVEELREAISKNLLNDIKYDDIKRTYGVPKTSLKRHIQSIVVHFKCDNRKDLKKFSTINGNEALLLEHIESIELTRSGPKPFHTQIERDIMFSIADQKDRAGSGQSHKAIGDVSRELCVMKAEGMDDDDPMKYKYENAKINKSWVLSNAKKITPTMLKAGRKSARFSKNSVISQVRAAAASPARDAIMKSKIKKWYEELFAAGILKTETPLPNQIVNGDEKGFAVNGGHPASFTLGRHKETRHFNIVTGERNPFWATLFFWIFADGTLPVPPTLVHEGGNDTSMPAKFLHGLPDNWTIHCTQSGYMDKEGFRAVIDSLKRYGGVSDTNPLFVFIDGHDSHWDAKAQQYAKDSNIHMFFLKANDSVNDQPCDMGANACLEAEYNRQMEVWRRKFVTTTFNTMYFNEGKFFTDGSLPTKYLMKLIILCSK
jgi:hypothetical protein